MAGDRSTWILVTLLAAAATAGYLSTGPLAERHQPFEVAQTLDLEEQERTTGTSRTKLSRPETKHNASDGPAFSLWFDHWNAYTQAAPVTGYPWTIVEPFKQTTFTARSNVTFDMSTVQWEIDGDSLEGQVVLFVFNRTGKVNVTLTATTPAGALVSVSDAFMCKYVRRELRGLSQLDRQAFLSALHKVYVTSSDEGKALYGSKFESIEWFARMHLEGAAAKDCDHWHDGAGLMVHHMSFTLGMEQVLQSIDPSIAMPYWEYTYDALKYGANWYSESEVFDASWFGAAHTNQSSEHVVTEGRWSYLPLRDNDDQYSPIANMYGLLRSPWNANPTPYLTRTNAVFDYPNAGFTTLPNCKTLEKCFAKDSLADMNVCLNGDTHGPVHIMIGGQYHAATNQTQIISDHKSTRIQLLVFKVLWRMGYAVCPEHCSAETEHTACVCTCPNVEHTALEVLTDKTGLMHWIDEVSDYIYYDEDLGRYNIKNYSPDKLQSAWHDLLQAFCSPGHVGELYTSNAPYDPLFWVIHTAGERMLSYKRILKEKGEISFDETWGYTRPSGVPSDTGMVCDWSMVHPGVQDYPSCVEDTCTGHNAEDLLPTNIFDEQYSNKEFYDFMHPFNEDLPYAYDTFEYSHCSAAGVDIGVDSVDSDDSTASGPPAGGNGDGNRPAKTDGKGKKTTHGASSREPTQQHGGLRR